MSNTNPANTSPARPLPERANLEHLRKEAKQLLKTMRLDDSGATLAAAQLATARQYGFTSWRRLVAYVTALRDKGNLLSRQIYCPRDVSGYERMVERIHQLWQEKIVEERLLAIV